MRGLTKAFQKKSLPVPDVTGNGLVHPSLQKYLGYTLFKSAVRMRSELMKSLEPFGILPAQFGIMKILKEGGPLNQQTLGESMGIDKATMVKLIDGLEKIKHVQRVSSKEDRRAKFVSLTDKGQKALDKMIEEALASEKEFLAPLSPAEDKALRAILLKLLNR